MKARRKEGPTLPGMAMARRAHRRGATFEPQATSSATSLATSGEVRRRQGGNQDYAESKSHFLAKRQEEKLKILYCWIMGQLMK